MGLIWKAPIEATPEGVASSRWGPGAERQLVDDLVRVEAEPTPNPNAYKLTTNRQVGSARGETFYDAAGAAASPLARSLFEIDGVRRVFFLGDFVTLARDQEADWSRILEQAERVIRAHFAVEPDAR